MTRIGRLTCRLPDGGVQRAGSNSLSAQRAGGVLVQRRVRWVLEDGPVVLRQAPGEPDQRFAFTGLLDPSDPVFHLRIERVPDAVFQP